MIFLRCADHPLFFFTYLLTQTITIKNTTVHLNPAPNWLLDTNKGPLPSLKTISSPSSNHNEYAIWIFQLSIIIVSQYEPQSTDKVNRVAIALGKWNKKCFRSVKFNYKFDFRPASKCPMLSQDAKGHTIHDAYVVFLRVLTKTTSLFCRLHYCDCLTSPQESFGKLFHKKQIFIC